jgi:exoribonuclease-2
VTEGLVQREDWVRLEDIPLQLRVPGVPTLPRGTRVELEILATDEVDLTVECRLLAIIEEVDDPALLDGAGGDFEEEASSA